MAKNDLAQIESAIIEYYLKEYGAIPTIVKPQEDPDFVCNVMDKLNSGRFRNNVIYGKGEYFRSSYSFIENNMKKSKLFKEITGIDITTPTFRYIGGKK